MIEISMDLGLDQGARDAQQNNRDIAEAQHIPHTPAEIATWLEQTYLPGSHAKVMTIVGGS